MYCMKVIGNKNAIADTGVKCLSRVKADSALVGGKGYG